MCQSPNSVTRTGSRVDERLKLFMSVCHAVQHAHQKGIIHRDIKPTNVLVTLHDGVPVAKVIDFGVAKATGQRLTDKTLFTAFAQMVGTPLYMSPEQAELSGLDVDTRSDIYSLGVLLYELLTGTTPFDKTRLRNAGYDELRRIIREEEPPKPSTRISTLGPGRHARSRFGGGAIRISWAARPRRAGLDRHEVPGKGPQPPLRIGQRPGAGHRSLFATTAGASLPALGDVSTPQIRPPQ